MEKKILKINYETFRANTLHTHTFKVHVPQLLTEIADSALAQNSGVLKIPLNVLRKYLLSVAERCSELNDPILNRLMCEMALYDEADPQSEHYNPEMIEQVYKTAEEFKKK